MPFTIIQTAEQVREFLENNVREKLHAEIDAYISLATKPEYADDYSDIVTYNEIAMVNLVSTAFTRNEEPTGTWALQEYEVFNNKKQFKGRADLFIRMKKPGKHIDLLIEAKRDGHFKKSDNEQDVLKQWKREIPKTMQQGLKYFGYEKEHFQVNSFVVTMFFGTFSNEEYNNTVVPKYDDKQMRDNATYQFFIKPIKGQKTLCVYGQILKVK